MARRQFARFFSFFFSKKKTSLIRPPFRISLIPLAGGCWLPAMLGMRGDHDDDFVFACVEEVRGSESSPMPMIKKSLIHPASGAGEVCLIDFLLTLRGRP